MGFYYWGARFRYKEGLLIGGKDFIVKWGLNGLKVLEERYWRIGDGIIMIEYLWVFIIGGQDLGIRRSY